MSGWIPVTPELSIPESEITYRASRSGGPGGQHVNTSSTRVELVWSAAESAALSEEQRARVLEELATRLSGDGVLTLASSATRSQQQNRVDVTERFAAILKEALHVPKRRKKTRPPAGAREERLRAKRRRAEVKRQRRTLPDD